MAALLKPVANQHRRNCKKTKSGKRTHLNILPHSWNQYRHLPWASSTCLHQPLHKTRSFKKTCAARTTRLSPGRAVTSGKPG